MKNITVTDVFHQSAQEGIQSHWCVQYRTDDNAFAQYEYFNTWTEANEFALDHGYED